MAEWKSANLAALLPPGTETILDTIEGLVTVVSVPLEIITTILDTAKSLIVSFSLFDFLSILSDLIEEWKESFLGSGFFICDMWDYPVRQLLTPTTTDYGPDQTFDKLNLSGHVFEDSFLAALSGSIDDTKDPFRPQFAADCSMIILVRAGSTPEALGLEAGEDSAGDSFAGMSESIGTAAKAIRTVRMRSMLAKLKEAAQASSSDRVQVRVERVEQALQMFGQMSDDEIDAVLFPEDEDTGVLFFEDKTATELDWLEDITPILESIEGQYEPTSYPDWTRIALRDIHPDLVRLADELFDPVIDLLQTGSDLKQQLVDFIDAIKAKVDYLQDLVDTIDEIVDDIERLINATGFHALYVSSSTGVDGLISKAQNAENVPFDGNNFYSGITIVAGSDTKAVFDALFGPIAS